MDQPPTAEEVPCIPAANGQREPEEPFEDSLERTKLSLEVRALQRAWWKQPEHYGPLLNVIVTFLIGLGTLGFLFFSGFFEQRSKVLELQRAKLELDVASLERDKHDLATEKDSLQAEVAAVEAQSVELASRSAGLQEQIFGLNEQKAKLATELDATRKMGRELEATQSALRKLNEEYLSAAEEGIRQLRLATVRGMVHRSLFGCSDVPMSECDLAWSEDVSPHGGYSAEQEAALSATERQLLATYAGHERSCLSRRPGTLLASPPADLVGATRDWLRGLDDCLQAWERPKVPQP